MGCCRCRSVCRPGHDLPHQLRTFHAALLSPKVQGSRSLLVTICVDLLLHSCFCLCLTGVTKCSFCLYTTRTNLSHLLSRLTLKCEAPRQQSASRRSERLPLVISQQRGNRRVVKKRLASCEGAKPRSDHGNDQIKFNDSSAPLKSRHPHNRTGTCAAAEASCGRGQAEARSLCRQQGDRPRTRRAARSLRGRRAQLRPAVPLSDVTGPLRSMPSAWCPA